MVRIDINLTPIGGQGMPNQGQPMQKIFLNAPTILKFLIGNDPKLSDLIILGKQPLMTTDKELYEAIGSLAKYDQFAPTKLSKLFEVVDVYPHRDLTRTQKPLLTFEKVESIRKEALKDVVKGEASGNGANAQKPSSKEGKEKSASR